MKIKEFCFLALLLAAILVLSVVVWELDTQHKQNEVVAMPVEDALKPDTKKEEPQGVAVIPEEKPDYYVLDVVATAYWTMDPVDASGTGLAADGKPAVPYKTIAVDPNVIPMQSEVYVPDIGWCIAHDTGGAIKGNKIDIAMDSEEAAYQWGRRIVRVKIKHS